MLCFDPDNDPIMDLWIWIGVKPEYFPSMGFAIFYAVEKLLGKENFSRPVKDAWVEVYGAISYDMIRGQKRVLAAAK